MKKKIIIDIIIVIITTVIFWLFTKQWLEALIIFSILTIIKELAIVLYNKYK